MTLTLAIGLMSKLAVGQTFKNFYIPSEGNNKASFYSPGKSGERTDMKRVIYYTDNGDGTFDVMDAHMFQGNPTAIVTQTIKITSTEVKLLKTTSTTMFETNKKQYHDPAKTLLKIPVAGQTASWTTQGERGDEPTKYTASWTTVNVDGKSKKALKVVSQYTGWKSKQVMYYVEGIGLMKTDFIDENGTTKPFEKFDGLSYESTDR